MKVYVEKIPKECYCCVFNIEDTGGMGGYCIFGGGKKNCPLQPLSAHTKQVRKEVYEEIRSKLDEISGEHEVKVKGGIGKFTCVPRHTLEELLDQIQD